MRYVLVLFAALCLFNCKQPKQDYLKKGIWRATLEAKDGAELPFNFEVKNDSSITIFNAEERIEVSEFTFFNDSIILHPPVFEGYIKAKLVGDSLLQGFFIVDELNRKQPFNAVYGESKRFIGKEGAKTSVEGNWETTFNTDQPASTYKGKGVFKQQGDIVTGTFRTTTGDFRYLEGVVEGDSLKLSAFDGAHAFLFKAKINDSTMAGSFYSGKHYKSAFTAKRNSTFTLADADSLTFIKPGYDGLAFSFPDETGRMVSLSDEQFKNKVVVVQLMGSWCPNCLDESKYFVEYLKTQDSEDLAFIGLAFEYAKTEEQAFKNINRLKTNLGITYPILLAQYGSTNKESAQDKLPMLNHILSYPTAIYIDKKGKVRKIHTGFNGPATGELYEDYKSEFKEFIGGLLKE